MSLWVLGTDTGVGKTVASALILARYGSPLDPPEGTASSPLDPPEGTATSLAYWKPIATGVATGREDEDDTETVRSLAPEGTAILEECYSFGPPVSPHLAARLAGPAIEAEKVLSDLGRHQREHASLVIEGIGGLLVPLNDAGLLLIDLVARSGLPAALVARSTLGTINHTLLSLEALRARKIEVAGVIANGPANLENAHAIERFGKVKVVSEVPPFPLSRGSVAGHAAVFDRQEVLKRPLFAPVHGS